MEYNRIIRINGNYVTVLYTKMYETVAKMVMQHYDNIQFRGNLFVINVLTDENSNDIDFRGQCPGGIKYIYYQLQNLFLYPEYVIHEHMDQFDEIWDFSICNINYYDETLKEKVFFMPLRYVDIPKIEPQDNYKYDVGFIGTLTPYRQDELSRITKYWTNDFCKIKIISGYPYSELYDEIKDCKYLIDLPRKSDSGFILGCTRIFDALCSGKQVLVETFGWVENVFTWLVKPYDNIYKIHDMVKDDPIDNSEIFKQWTNTDESYEYYRKQIMGDNYKQKLNL